MNKIALITGGSRGLGKDMAIQLAQKGIHAIVTYNTGKEEALSVVEMVKSNGLKSYALHLNLADFSTVKQFSDDFKALLIEEFGTNKFDFLINNAGMGKTVPFMEVSEQLFDDFLNVHYKSVYFLTQYLVASMNPNGCIINISSGTTRFSNPGYSVYASMKGAMEVLTKYWAKELGAFHIRCNIVAPGPVETDFNSAAIRNNPNLKANLANMSPLGRVGQPDDIGSVVAFLCSDDAKWINGQRIEVSGGINS